MEETLDCNGKVLKAGDTIIVIKDLKVKGTSAVIKRGTKVKNIRLNGNTGEIEGKTPQVKNLVLRSEFVKKA
jgi:protein PhnA